MSEVATTKIYKKIFVLKCLSSEPTRENQNKAFPKNCFITNISLLMLHNSKNLESSGELALKLLVTGIHCKLCSWTQTVQTDHQGDLRNIRHAKQIKSIQLYEK